MKIYEELKFEEIINKEAMEVVLKTLSGREQKIIHMRFYQEMTLQACADEEGVSRERIRQILAKAIRRLRHPSRARILKGFNKESHDR